MVLHLKIFYSVLLSSAGFQIQAQKQEEEEDDDDDGPGIKYPCLFDSDHDYILSPSPSFPYSVSPPLRYEGMSSVNIIYPLRYAEIGCMSQKEHTIPICAVLTTHCIPSPLLVLLRSLLMLSVCPTGLLRQHRCASKKTIRNIVHSC